VTQSTDNERLVVRFSGRVQGVGFRATVMHHAPGLDVGGFVRNEPDGCVLLDADGPQQELQTLLSRIQDRPAGEIDGCDVNWTTPLGRSGGISIG